MHLQETIKFLTQVDELKVAKDLLNTFAKYAKTLEQYDELGMLFEKIKAYPESLEMLKKCKELATNSNHMYSINSNFAKVYNHLNEPLKALEHIELNLKKDPNNVDLKLEQSFSHYIYGNYKKSWDIQLEILNNPNISENIRNRINFNMGSYDLEQGLFKQGMAKMILGGKKIGLWPSVPKSIPKWNGEFTDKTILVYAEAGIGDEILHVRFMNEIKNRNMNAIWIGGNDSIREVIKFSGFNVLDNDTTLNLFSGNYVYSDSSSLSVLLELDLCNLWNGVYLKVHENYIAKWKEILPNKFVTIRWNGNPYYDQDLHRGIPFNLLYNTVRNNISSNIDIVSLQIDENRQEYENLINVNIENWFDTMAIQHLALINITSCTSTAHSAGAIGANCIVMPPICTYYPWVYLKENKNSYWYGTNLKAFVQSKWRNWDEPMNLLKHELGVLNAE